MEKRFVSIWFRHLATDWFALDQRIKGSPVAVPDLNDQAFVLRAFKHGRMIVTATNSVAEQKGLRCGMPLADARAIIPDLIVKDDKPDLVDKLLKRLAEWCIRFTPITSMDPPDGLVLDASGCAHLWGGEQSYLEEIVQKLNHRGYDVRTAMADTLAVAWAVARFGNGPNPVALSIPSPSTMDALLPLPPEALRLEEDTISRLHRLGLHRISQFINMPRSSLRRRFGPHFIMRLDKALGQEIETLVPVNPPEPYQERLPCLEPIVTATGIEIALKELLTSLCFRLSQEQKGLRKASLKCYRIDNKIEEINIGTHRPSHHVSHLFKLFETTIASIEPALGIELFVLEAQQVEDHFGNQEMIWKGSGGLEDVRVSELIDRLAGKIGIKSIHRYLPDEHYWPEHSFRPATSLDELPSTSWRRDKLRPLTLLKTPEPIEVTAPIPDYPPMLFRRRGKLHKIILADGPERIEQEWWIQKGQHRDYYHVEDEEGKRYWIFRLGHYDDEIYQWFLHGFFA
jgi:protein ImuB